MADMAGTSYISYLVLLLLLPVVVRWRWGLVAALVVVVAELAVVALVFYLLNAYHMFPDQFAAEPPPRAPMEIMRRGYERSAVAWVYLVAWWELPQLPRSSVVRCRSRGRSLWRRGVGANRLLS